MPRAIRVPKFEIRRVVLPIIIITVIFFFLQVILGPIFTNSLLLEYSDIFSRPWILITHMFVHGGLGHLFFNMYVLFMFGFLLEQKIGPKRFLLIYLGAGILAAIVTSLIDPVLSPLFTGAPSVGRALGASGAIMGMLGVLIVLMPRLKLLLFFIIPMPLWMASLVIALIDVFGLFYQSGVGNLAHLVGLAVGLIYGLYLKKQGKRFTKRFTAKPSGNHMSDDEIEHYYRSGRL